MNKLIEIKYQEREDAISDFLRNQPYDIWDPTCKYYEKSNKLEKANIDYLNITEMKNHLEGRHYFRSKNCQLCSEMILRLSNAPDGPLP